MNSREEIETMRCLHCGIDITNHYLIKHAKIWESSQKIWQVKFLQCPSCQKYTFHLICESYEESAIILPRGSPYSAKGKFLKDEILVKWPRSAGRPPCPEEVPASIAKDYKVSCLILFDSPEASSALSRRCLQNIIREKYSIREKTLYNEIGKLKEKNILPSDLLSNLDYLREIGNLSSHPTKDTITDKIVPVEPGEAEFCLDILESLFDFAYVAPAKREKSRKRIDEKLESAGKKPPSSINNNQ